MDGMAAFQNNADRIVFEGRGQYTDVMSIPTPRHAPNIGTPDASEYAPYYGRYISLVGADDILAALEEQVRGTQALLAGLSEAQGDYRYAPEKWSVKEVLGHLIDTERVFAYRALRVARNDRTPLPGFEQDDYVRYGDFATQQLTSLIEEFVCVRRSNLLLFRQFGPEAWMRRGIADQKEISVRALAYIIAGHELHHRQVLQEKYLQMGAGF
jgi:DinB superfamily